MTWLAGRSSAPTIYWRDRDGWEYGAAGSACRIEGQGPDAIANVADEAVAFLRHRLVAEAAPLHRQMRFFGGFSFDPQTPPDDLWCDTGFSDALLVLPEALYIRRGLESHILLSIAIPPDASPAALPTELKRLNDRYWPESAPAQTSPMPPPLELLAATDDATDGERHRWHEAASGLLALIEGGALDKAVLSRRRRYNTSPAATCIDPWTVLRALRTKTPDCYQFSFRPRDSHAFVGASPERLLRLQGRRLDSECVAGTTGRGESADVDRELATALMSATKDRREHDLVVSGVHDTLGPLCRQLSLADQPELLVLATLQHLRTPVSAELNESVTLGDVLKHLHPTPSVGGWPRPEALRAIREAERSSRGWYAAPVGWIGADAAEFAVGIRSALIVDRAAWLFAGAGLVSGSDPEREWRETDSKLLAFLTALRS
ncbi:MAG: isochorismate synthase [Candidatus Zixiibacteriota bacterium]